MSALPQQGQGHRLPRLERNHLGCDLAQVPNPPGPAWWEYQVIDTATTDSFSGDNLSILLGPGGCPAEFHNGRITPVTAESLDKGQFYTLRSINDYRFDWTTRRWVPTDMGVFA